MRKHTITMFCRS